MISSPSNPYRISVLSDESEARLRAAACPFCGSTSLSMVERAGNTWASCVGCGATGPVARTEAGAITLWSRRRLARRRPALAALVWAGASLAGGLVAVLVWRLA